MATGQNEIIRNGDIVSVQLNYSDSANGEDGFAIVISADVLNDHLQTVIVCPLIDAGQVKQSRIGATIIPKEVIGLEQDNIVFSLQIKTIAKSQIVKRISSIPNIYMSQIKESLQAVLDIHQ